MYLGPAAHKNEEIVDWFLLISIFTPVNRVNYTIDNARWEKELTMTVSRKYGLMAALARKSYQLIGTNTY